MSSQAWLTFSIDEVMPEEVLHLLFQQIELLGFSAFSPSGSVQGMDATGEGSLMFWSVTAAKRWLAHDAGLVTCWKDGQTIDVSVDPPISGDDSREMAVWFPKSTLLRVTGLADAVPRWAHQTARAVGAMRVVGEAQDLFGFRPAGSNAALEEVGADLLSLESAWIAGERRSPSHQSGRVSSTSVIGEFADTDFLTLQTSPVPWGTGDDVCH